MLGIVTRTDLGALWSKSMQSTWYRPHQMRICTRGFQIYIYIYFLAGMLLDILSSDENNCHGNFTNSTEISENHTAFLLNTASQYARFSNKIILQVHSLALIFINLISVCSNLSVIYLYVTRKTLRTGPNVIVLSLTSSDLLFATIMFSFSLTGETARRSDASVNCVLITFVANLSNTVSGWSLVALTGERYVSIHRPFHNRMNIRKKYFLLTVLGIWCVGLVTTGIILMPWMRDQQTRTSVLCGGLVQYTVCAACMIIFTQTLLPLSIITTLYLLIARTARRHHRSIRTVQLQLLTNQQSPQSRDYIRASPRNSPNSWFKHIRKAARGTKFLLYAALGLALTWLPIFLVLQLFIFCIRCNKRIMYYLFFGASILSHMKGFIHPLTYTLRDKAFRDAARQTLSQISTRCKRWTFIKQASCSWAHFSPKVLVFVNRSKTCSCLMNESNDSASKVSFRD